MIYVFILPFYYEKLAPNVFEYLLLLCFEFPLYIVFNEFYKPLLNFTLLLLIYFF